MTTTETELKISEEPLAERVLRQVRSGTLHESRLLPAGAGRGQEARPVRGAGRAGTPSWPAVACVNRSILSVTLDSP